jgi:hypothetical protein
MQNQNTTSTESSPAKFYAELEQALKKEEQTLNASLNDIDSETLEAMAHDINRILSYRRKLTRQFEMRENLEATKDIASAPIGLIHKAASFIREQGRAARTNKSPAYMR